MSAFAYWATALGGPLLGFVLTSAIGKPYWERRGYAQRVEEERIEEGPAILAGRVHPIVDVALPEHVWPTWGPAEAKPPTLRERARRIRFRADWSGWLRLGDPLGVAAKVDAGLLGLAAAPAPRAVELAAAYVQREPVRADAEPQPGEVGHPDYPWKSYPLEPGLGDHDEQEPDEAHHARHAAEPDEPEPVSVPVVDEPTGAFWEIVGSGLFDLGLVEVDPGLALPCYRCTNEGHKDCPGCSCPCKLQEVAG